MRVSNISIWTPAWANFAISAAVAWPWLDAKAAQIAEAQKLAREWEPKPDGGRP